VGKYDIYVPLSHYSMAVSYGYKWRLFLKWVLYTLWTLADKSYGCNWELFLKRVLCTFWTLRDTISVITCAMRTAKEICMFWLKYKHLSNSHLWKFHLLQCEFEIVISVSYDCIILVTILLHTFNRSSINTHFTYSFPYLSFSFCSYLFEPFQFSFERRSSH
jgi:hypothetical protein